MEASLAARSAAAARVAGAEAAGQEPMAVVVAAGKAGKAGSTPMQASSQHGVPMRC